MELKDVILSTLAEMDDTTQEAIQKPQAVTQTTYEEPREGNYDSEFIYLNSIRERLLVLFEGFQSPNNANIEAKVDMTLNFLEYTLATIDERIQKIEKGNL